MPAVVLCNVIAALGLGSSKSNTVACTQSNVLLNLYNNTVDFLQIPNNMKTVKKRLPYH